MGEHLPIEQKVAGSSPAPRRAFEPVSLYLKGKSVLVRKIVSPRWSFRPQSSRSSRNLELLGNSPPVSSSEYSGFVSSGVFQSGCHGPATSNWFHLVAHPSLLGVLGLFNVWMSGPSDREDIVIGMWAVLGLIEEGYSR